MNNISTRILSEDDWHIYQLLRDKELPCCSNEAECRRRLNETHSVTFGLFTDEQLIGYAGLNFSSPNHVLFSFAYIDPDHRGNRYGDFLHNVRKSYLKENGINTICMTKIYNKNTISQRVAERNGFTKTGHQIVEDGAIYDILSCEL